MKLIWALLQAIRRFIMNVMLIGCIATVALLMLVFPERWTDWVADRLDQVMFFIFAKEYY